METIVLLIAVILGIVALMLQLSIGLKAVVNQLRMPEPEPEPDESEVEALRNEVKKLKEQKKSLEMEQVPKLKAEIKQLELDKKIEEEDIKHMLALKEEKQELENAKFQQKCEKERDDAIMKIEKEFATKLRERLEADIQRGDARFEQILQRLPSAHIKMTEDRNTTRDQEKSR